MSETITNQPEPVNGGVKEAEGEWGYDLGKRQARAWDGGGRGPGEETGGSVGWGERIWRDQGRG